MRQKHLQACAGRGLPALIIGALAVMTGAGTSLAAESGVTAESRLEVQPPFGGPMNIEYAQLLWEQLEANRLVGPDSIRSYPYEGNHPHGQALEYLESTIRVGGHAGVVMVKKNYAGEGGLDTLKTGVLERRDEHLDSVTVMFQREEGYDPAHDNWYWAKYQPDGGLETNPKDMSLAGRVAKGADKRCIACHSSAPGDDYVFTHARFAD